MLFLTRSERDRLTPLDGDRVETGLRVEFPNGAVHFFPGGTVQFAWTLLVNSPAAEWVNHPKTGIEFGERRRGVFTMKKTIKHVVRSESEERG